jgi:hypothetical protein
MTISRRLLVSAVCAVALLSACSGSSGSSGVSGSLQAVGGTSPHRYAGYPGVVRALQHGRVVATTSTQSDGTFSMSLKAGSYVIAGMWKGVCGGPCNWTKATCGEQDSVQVLAHQTEKVVVTCDLK